MLPVYDAKNKLWQAAEKQLLENSKVSAGQQMLDSLLKHGSNVAVINDDNGVQITYNELWLKTVRAAQNLQSRGFEPRQVFCFMADHSDNLTPIILASACLACPILALHPSLSKDEIVRILKKAKPSAVFCDGKACDEMKAALKEMQLNAEMFTLDGHFDGFEPVESLFAETNMENDFVPVDCDIDKDIGVIACSSGTTGPSKCVKLQYNRSLFQHVTKFDSSSVVFCYESIFWTISVKPIIDSIFNGATRVITKKEYTPALPLKIIDKYKVNILSVATYDLVACLKVNHIQTFNLSSVTQIFIYGSKMPNNLWSQVFQYFPNAKLSSFYGMTEIGVISLQILDAQHIENGSYLVNGFVAKVVDRNGNRCGPNVNGELCVKRNNEFLGYIDDPKATAAAIDDEGFFRTGDIVHFDGSGLLFIDDRKKNVITLFYFDSSLLPTEIEDFLILMPDIEEVCVVGIPTTILTCLAAAVVVLKPNSKLKSRDIFNAVGDNFPDRLKLRGGVYFVKSLPKTHNGKMIRTEITKHATKMFISIRNSDPDIQSYLADIPEDYKKII